MRLKDIIDDIGGEYVGISYTNGKILFDTLRNKRSYIRKFCNMEIDMLYSGMRVTDENCTTCAESYIKIIIKDKE